MTHDEINRVTGQIVDAALTIHRCLGPGLLESVYQATMIHELEKRGLAVEHEKPIPVHYDDLTLDVGFRADLIVAGVVLVELKSVANLTDVHKKQIHTYLRLTGLSVGLLINFNVALIRDGITRVVNGFQDHSPRPSRSG